MKFRHTVANLSLVLLGLAAMQGNARANIVLTFFPASDFNANSAAMDTTLGLTITEIAASKGDF
jgi:hypothetical protein